MAAQSSPNNPTASAISQKATILIFGDSLSAAYGLPRNQGWVSLLQRRLDSNNLKYNVENRSLSGETTFGGLERLPRALAQVKPRLVVLQLGANDGLRGLDLRTSRANLKAMIQKSLDAKARVVIVGVRLPPNLGETYLKEFDAIVPSLAKELQVQAVPAMLKGFAEDLGYFQEDQIHPNAKAQPIILETLWKAISPLL
ncbi:MAG: arylesterase [Burkholderiaceae bacterium]|nr:arylesterase [Burkholderiaceae bacterium]MDP4949917.1 arylesterase [Burkholderiaceae bacterium]MDP5127124.1 arylesterase [Burkholderiaceae bacterium]